MVAGLFPAAIALVDAGIDQPVRRLGAEQQMINPEPGIALPGPGLIIPEGPHPTLGRSGAHRVRPARKISNPEGAAHPKFGMARPRQPGKGQVRYRPQDQADHDRAFPAKPCIEHTADEDPDQQRPEADADIVKRDLVLAESQIIEEQPEGQVCERIADLVHQNEGQHDHGTLAAEELGKGANDRANHAFGRALGGDLAVACGFAHDEGGQHGRQGKGATYQISDAPAGAGRDHQRERGHQFLARHARAIDGTARPEQVARVKAEMSGAIVMVEEAGQLVPRDMERIVRLANMTDVARVVQTGDTRQLPAIAAGKPFEASQRAGVATAHITENLRSRSDQMKAVTAALDRGDVSGTFEILKPATTEVPGNAVATTAAAQWATLPRAERDATLLLTAGRAMRSEANQAVQAELKASGEIAATGTSFTVLDRVNATKEGARLMRAYRPGHVVEVRTNLPSQGLVRGDRGVVTGVEGDRVRLGMADGTEKLFRPGRLARNLDRDAVSIFASKQVELHVGDRIRWSDNDRARGLDNGAMARVEEVGRGRVVVSR